MLVFLISFIEWAKLIVGSMLIVLGTLSFLQTNLGFLLTSKTSYESWKSFAMNHITAVIILLAGFYIAGW